MWNTILCMQCVSQWGLPKLPIQKLHCAAVPHTLLSVHASNRIGTSACSKRTEVCNMSFQTDQTQTVQIICQTGINQLSPATFHSLWYIPSSANKHQPTMRSLGMLTSGSIFLRHSHSFFILWRYLRSVTEIGLFARCAKPFRITVSSAWHVFPHWINNAGSQNSR